MHILYLEDNRDFREEVTFHLEHAGYSVTARANADELELLLQEQVFDIALLDVGLPGEGGHSIAQKLRQRFPQMGIVMLTAWGMLNDRLSGLQNGADAYLVKPVDMRELIATLQSLSRRIAVNPANESPCWVLAWSSKVLISPEQLRLPLTPGEALILKLIMEVSPETASRKHIVEGMGYDAMTFDFRRLETNISRLRKRLDRELPQQGQHLIRAVRNKGYTFTSPCRVVSHY